MKGHWMKALIKRIVSVLGIGRTSCYQWLFLERYLRKQTTDVP